MSFYCGEDSGSKKHDSDKKTGTSNTWRIESQAAEKQVDK
jgi:hypothetical protein